MAVKVNEVTISDGVVSVSVMAEDLNGKVYAKEFDQKNVPVEDIIKHFKDSIERDLQADLDAATIKAALEKGLAEIDVSAKLAEIQAAAEPVEPLKG